MYTITQRRVARALRPGGPDVIEVGIENLGALKTDEALVRVEAAGHNHAETLIRSGNYAVRIPFPYFVGGEGSVRGAGATDVIDRAVENVREVVRAHTDGHGVAAVFDPIGAATFETSLQLLAPRGCLINYGELSGPIPSINLNHLFPGSVFVTKCNGMRWVQGLHESNSLISDALKLAARRPSVVSDVAARFHLDEVVDAYRAIEANPHGKVLVLPNV
jgi:NADPH:quinone reductase-like Zn-dependent oxidoreductase